MGRGPRSGGRGRTDDAEDETVAHAGHGVRANDAPLARTGAMRQGGRRTAGGGDERKGRAGMAHRQIPSRRMMSPKFSPDVRACTFSHREGE
jgi:hypothetical protein